MGLGNRDVSCVANKDKVLVLSTMIRFLGGHPSRVVYQANVSRGQKLKRQKVEPEIQVWANAFCVCARELLAQRTGVT